MASRLSRNVGQISNELEFALYGITADELIERMGPGFPIEGEVNTRDMIEINVSQRRDLADLNRRAIALMAEVVGAVGDMDGQIYGGSSALSDTSDVEPAEYRTTLLSRACGRGFLEIPSQQMVLGVNDEALGFEIYNYFRRIAPVMTILSASSPFRFEDGRLVDCGYSRRIPQYNEICREFPDIMWRYVPELHSIREYEEWLGRISEAVLTRLGEGLMDANMERLRELGLYPFDRLAEHQIYWWIRPRPSHANEESRLSMEIRVPDMPTTPERILMMNDFVVGLAYYIADHGVGSLPEPLEGRFEEIENASLYSPHEVHNTFTRILAEGLVGYAETALSERGYDTSRFRLLWDTIERGNEACEIRHFVGRDTTPEMLRDYLAARLIGVRYADTNTQL